jgi:hypothetical protein
VTPDKIAAAPDIRRPYSVDAAWLSSALESAGIDAVVRDVHIEPVGTGQLGDTVRFRIGYARGGEDAPQTLIGKFAAADPDSRKTAVALGNYVREVKFYQQFATSTLISVPRCYLAKLDEPTHSFVLLLEDLAPAEPGDQLRGVSIEQARLVIDEAAKLHASRWADESLGEMSWIWGTRASPISRVGPERVRATWLGFRERFLGGLSEQVRDVGERFTQRYGEYQALPRGPLCLTHYDFRPDNMMFASPAGGRPVTVLDWQSIAQAPGAVDVAFFLGGALKPKVRREHEPALLARYLEGLRRLGVEDYDEQALQWDYRTGAFRLFMTGFLACMAVRQTPRGDQMFLQMIGAAAEHILDNDALGVLD